MKTTASVARRGHRSTNPGFGAHLEQRRKEKAGERNLSPRLKGGVPKTINAGKKKREPHKSEVRALGAAACRWWTQRDSNPRPLGCEPNALPAELWAHKSCSLSKQLLYFSTRPGDCKAFLRVFCRFGSILEQVDVQPLSPVKADHKDQTAGAELGGHGQPHANQTQAAHQH